MRIHPHFASISSDHRHDHSVGTHAQAGPQIFQFRSFSRRRPHTHTRILGYSNTRILGYARYARYAQYAQYNAYNEYNSNPVPSLPSPFPLILTLIPSVSVIRYPFLPISTIQHVHTLQSICQVYTVPPLGPASTDHGRRKTYWRSNSIDYSKRCRIDIHTIYHKLGWSWIRRTKSGSGAEDGPESRPSPCPCVRVCVCAYTYPSSSHSHHSSTQVLKPITHHLSPCRITRHASPEPSMTTPHASHPPTFDSGSHGMTGHRTRYTARW